MSTTRKSSRASKQTVLLNIAAPPPPASAKKAPKQKALPQGRAKIDDEEDEEGAAVVEDEEEDAMDEDGEDDDDDDDDDDEEDDEDVFAPLKVKSKKGAGSGRAQAGGKQQQKSSKAKAAQQPDLGNAKNSIFGMSSQFNLSAPNSVLTPSSPPLSPAAFGSKMSESKLTDVAKLWNDGYKENKLLATIKLINSVLFAAGVKQSKGLNEVEDEVQDLEALDAEELDELLTPATESIDETCPLLNTKTGANFRKQFGIFFSKLAACIVSGSGDTDIKKMDEELKAIVEPFTMMTSFGHSNYRFAFSLASLKMATALVKLARSYSDTAATQQRLFKAETGKSSGARPTEKSATMKKQLAILTQKATTCKQFADEIFASVFMHRSKDIKDNIRSLCMEHLGDLILTWPEEFLKDTYLKYFGWYMTDPCVAVRLNVAEALKHLVDLETFAERLQEFVARFHEKMVHLAAQDSSPKVCKVYTEMLVTLHHQGLVDEVPDEEINVVDQVVFDPTATQEMRQEALVFLIAHTENFDDEDNEDNEDNDDNDEEDEDDDQPKAKGSKAKAKGGKSSKRKVADDAKALARRQKQAVQLETLTEIVDFHIKDAAQFDSRTKIFVDVCLGQGKLKSVLRAWPTMVALLLKESDAKITGSLRPVHSAILLRMFVFSAEQLSDKLGPYEERAHNKADAQDVSDWRQLTDVLHKDLSKLIKRFSDDRDNLRVLSLLLACADFSGNDKALKPLLKVLEGVLETASVADTVMVKNVCDALRKWTSLGEQSAGAVEPVLASVFKSTWGKVEDSEKRLRALIDAPAPSKKTTAKGKRGAGTQSSPPLQQIEDALLSLHLAVAKQLELWKSMDCRSISRLEPSDCADQLVEVIDCVVALGDTLPAQSDACETCIRCAQGAAEVVFSIMLWVWRDAYKLVKETAEQKQESEAKMKKKKSKGKSKGEDEDEDDSMAVVLVDDEHDNDVLEDDRLEEFDGIVQAVLDIRGKLLDTLLTWMQLGKDGDMDVEENGDYTKTPELHLRLQRSAFIIVNDIRLLFPSKFKTFPHLFQLCYQPSAEILAGLRRVFELEGARSIAAMNRAAEADTEAGSDDDDDDAAGGKAEGREAQSGVLQNLMLSSLSSTIIFDLANINRRQAAAVLGHILDKDERITSIVKALTKKLKSKAPASYLQVQLVALKSTYLELVEPHARARAEAEEGNEEDGYDEKSNFEEISRGLERINQFAAALTTNWGVGNKLPPDASKALLSFFKVALTFALEKPSHYPFVETLSLYFKFVPKDDESLDFIADHLKELIAKVDGLEDKLEDAKEYKSSYSLSALQCFFKSKLPNGEKWAKRDRDRLSFSFSVAHRAKGDGDEDEEGDEEDVFAPKVKVNKPKAKKPKAKKPKAKLPMMKSNQLKFVVKPKAKPKAKKASSDDEEDEDDLEDVAGPQDEDEEDEEDEEEERVVEVKPKVKPASRKAPSAKAPKVIPLKSKKASFVYKDVDDDDDDDDDDEEEEEELEKTLISDKNRRARGRAPAPVDDEDEDEEELEKTLISEKPLSKKRGETLVLEPLPRMGKPKMGLGLEPMSSDDDAEDTAQSSDRENRFATTASSKASAKSAKRAAADITDSQEAVIDVMVNIPVVRRRYN